MTLCLNLRPSIPLGLLSDPYFQREVFGEINVAAVIATAAEFIQQLADALKNFGMAMLGAFKEAMDAVADAVEKVVNVINAIIDWIVEQIGVIVQFVIDKITALLSGLEEAYKNLLYALVDLSSESSKTTSQLTMSGTAQSSAGFGIIADFFELVIELAMDFVLIALTITAMILAITAATGGLAALANLVVEQGIGNMVVGLLFTAAMAEIFGEIGELIQNSEDDSGGGFAVIAGFLGLTGNIVEKLVNVGETTSVYTKGKIGIFGYYIGLTLAFTGLLAPIVIPTMNLDHNGTIAADAFSLLMAFLGFEYSRWLAKKDAQVKGNEIANPWLSKIELATSIAGVASPAIKLGADLAGGD